VYSLPPEEQDQSLVLLCQTYPTSDLTIELPYNRDMISFGHRAGTEYLLTRIHAFERCTPSVHRLVLEHLNPKTMRPRALSYTPGQYLNVSIPGTDQWRSFSMACPPRDDGLIELLVKDLPGGLFSEHFWKSARVGLELVVQGPYGMFHVNRHSGRPRCFLAGGTGIAPILAMLRHMQQTQDTTPARVTLHLGADDAQLCADELAGLQKAMRGLQVERVTASRSDPRSLETFMAGVAGFATPPDVYLCGPEGLVVAAEQACRGGGLDPRQIYCERFVPTGILAGPAKGEPGSSPGLRVP
jgi:methane monooxygenase component C